MKGSPPVHSAALACHTATPSRAVNGVAVQLALRAPGSLALTYTIRGKIDELRVPAPAAPRFTDDLWQSTCCEAFVRCKGAPAYCEFNFAPSAAWAAYGFNAYRDGMAALDDAALDPGISVNGDAGQLSLDATIRLDRCRMLQACSLLCLGLSAVIEERGGQRSYWALAHPPGKPDFHSPLACVLELRREGAQAAPVWTDTASGNGTR